MKIENKWCEQKGFIHEITYTRHLSIYLFFIYIYINLFIYFIIFEWGGGGGELY